MKKLLLFLLFFISLFLASFSLAKAVCPVCTVAVAGGLGLSRYLGIDDAVSGIWAGGLVISVSFWFAGWLKKKNLIYLSIIFWTALTYLPLWKLGIIGHTFNTIWGIDKLIFGSAIGAITFLLAVFTDNKMRKIKGKHLFNFQKVIIPLSFLVIASLLMYFYGGYLK